MSLQAAVMVRIAVGVIESKETRELRQRGAAFRYRRLPVFETAIGWIVRLRGRPFGSEYGVYETISDGLLGRTPQNVTLIYLTNPTYDDIERCVSAFPNMERLVLRKPGRYVQTDFDDLPQCCRNTSYVITSYVGYDQLHLWFDQ